MDGGSTDASVEVIKEALADAEYAKHVTWWCSEKDSGIYNAMNKGIRHAGGKYIATLNSGDFYLPNALEGIKESAQKNEGAVLYGAISTFLDGNFCGTVCTPASGLPKGMIPHPASFVPIEVYKKYGLYDESFRSSGDWELFLRFYKSGISFEYINKIITNFNLCGISSMQCELVAAENKRLLMRHGFYKVTYKQRVVRLIKTLLHVIMKVYSGIRIL